MIASVVYDTVPIQTIRRLVNLVFNKPTEESKNRCVSWYSFFESHGCMRINDNDDMIFVD